MGGLGTAGPPGAAEAAALARLYDVDLVDDPGDLDLYLALARRSGGPILELGVGTGRLGVPLAKAGFDVTGIDNDAQMLARARAAADAAGVSVALVEADLTEVRLPSAGTFGLAFLALNSLFLLAGRDGQRAALRTMAAHLAPGGVAAVDVWLPGADDLARFDGRLMLEYGRVDPETGRPVTKIASAQHEPASQMVTLTTLYEEGGAGEPPIRWMRTDRLRLVSADDLRLFAEDAGLVVEVLAGGYDLEPIGPTSDRAVLVATRSPG